MMTFVSWKRGLENSDDGSLIFSLLFLQREVLLWRGDR